jgi:hypothetical protein
LNLFIFQNILCCFFFIFYILIWLLNQFIVFVKLVHHFVNIRNNNFFSCLQWQIFWSIELIF